jgi:hypothetical protein
MSVTAAIRRAALETFPVGTQFIIVAPNRSEFAELVGERNDASVALLGLGAVAMSDAPLDPTILNVLLEGLDDLDNPVAFLAGLHRKAPQARVFALIANGAHIGSLGAFFAGIPLAAAHPLVRDEIEPLFHAAGWQPLAIRPFNDEAIPPVDALPFSAGIGEIVFNLSEPAMLERCRCTAFLVIADHA